MVRVSTATETEISVLGRPVLEDPIKHIKRTNVLIFTISFLFLSASITSTFLQNMALYYLVLLIGLLTIVLLHERDMNNAGQNIEVLPSEHFMLGSIPQQVIGGFVLLVAYLVPMLILGSITPIRSTTPSNFFETFGVQVAMVGIVEAVMLIVYVRVVFMGIVIFPFLFAFIHPSVGPMWAQGIITPDSVLFFASAVIFGFIFIAIFLLRDVLKPAKIQDERGRELYLGRGNAWRYFGAITMAIFHAGINTISIFAHLSIGGIGI